MFDSALLYVEYLVCQNKNVFSNRSAGRHKKDKFERAGDLRSDLKQKTESVPHRSSSIKAGFVQLPDQVDPTPKVHSSDYGASGASAPD